MVSFTRESRAGCCSWRTFVLSQERTELSRTIHRSKKKERNVKKAFLKLLEWNGEEQN